MAFDAQQEDRRLNALGQLGITSWMPRQPLPGAKPSVFFSYERAEAEKPVHGRLSDLLQSSAPAQNGPSVTEVVRQESRDRDRADARDNRQSMPAGEQPAQEIPVAVATELSSVTPVNRVPAELQLAFIMLPAAERGPLIISHLGSQAGAGVSSDQALLPLVQGIVPFAGFSGTPVSLPFFWPLPGMSPICQEREFVQTFRALLSGARLQCTLPQACWWFGPLPELLAAHPELLDIQLHFEHALPELMQQGVLKRQLMMRLLALRKPQ